MASSKRKRTSAGKASSNRQKAAKKKVTKKKTAAKKTTKKKVVKKTAAKKTAAKKTAAKKTAAKKTAAKKTAAKKTAAKKTAAKKTATKKTAAKKTAPAASATPQVVLAPRSTASIAPSIPIPVREVERAPTLEERAEEIAERLNAQSEEFLADYEENVNMSWIYHDTALEGVVYTFDELTTAFRSNEVTVVDSSVMPIYDAIRRHKAAILYARELAAAKRFDITVDLLKDLHTIFKPEDGDVKAVKYRREVPQHRLYFHEYAAPDKIAHRVRTTLDWFADPDTAKNVPPLRIAAKVHYDLVRAFPFPITSGKIARLLMNIILIRNGLPPAIIHATERQRYYETLKAPTAANLVKMLEDTLNNSLLSIDKMLIRHRRSSGS